MEEAKKIHYATTNKGKVKSLRDTLSKHGIEVEQLGVEIPEPRTDDLKKIAREKILFAYDKIKKPCVALDAGFYVNALKGFPKAFVNFVLETIEIEGILKLMEGKSFRECEFRNCMAYLDPYLSEPVYFESSVKGTLALSARGTNSNYAWSKLSFIFIPDSYDKTLAELTDEEYRAWRSPRKDSYSEKFAEYFLERARFLDSMAK